MPSLWRRQLLSLAKSLASTGFGKLLVSHFACTAQIMELQYIFRSFFEAPLIITSSQASSHSRSMCFTISGIRGLNQ